MGESKFFEPSLTFIIDSYKSLMNKTKFILGVVIMITLGTTPITTTPGLLESANALKACGGGDSSNNGGGEFNKKDAPPAITGDNVYVAWWTNKTGNDEVIFRASTDKGQTFGEKINLSTSTDADSTRVLIDSDADSVVVTWWETNQTDDTPVMRVSNDNGKTFGPLLKLATNGTLDG
jgi:hypothetical protein